MGGDVNISIRIASIEGEAKNLAKAADSDGSGSIDTAYEHSLWTQYCDAAGVDVSDYSAKYSGDDTQKAEKKLIKEQKFSGSVKENVANLEQYEAVWQQAMKTAFESVGKDPVSRAKLMEFIKTKPKLQNSTSMADYSFALGQKIIEMGKIVDKDLKEFAIQLTQNAVAQVNQNTDNDTKYLDSHLDAQDANMENIKNLVIADLKVDLQDLEIDLQDYNLDQQIAKYSKQILGVVRDTNRQVKAIKNLVLADLRVDLNTNAVAHDNNRLAYDTNAVAHDTNQMAYINNFEIHNNRDEILNNRDEIRNQGELTRQHVSDEAHLNTIDAEYAEATNVTGNVHTTETVKRLDDMYNKVRSSDLPQAEKEELLTSIKTYAHANIIYNDSELDTIEKIVNKKLGIETSAEPENEPRPTFPTTGVIGLVGSAVVRPIGVVGLAAEAVNHVKKSIGK